MTTQTLRLARPVNRYALVAVPAAILAFLASPTGPLGFFWRPSPDFPTPTGIQLPLFILLNAASALAFGVGAAFLAFGYPAVRRVLPGQRGLALATYLSIAWSLMNWWPHGSLHIANGLALGGLLAIDWAFHGTLMLAGGVLVYFVLALVRQQPVRPR